MVSKPKPSLLSKQKKATLTKYDIYTIWKSLTFGFILFWSKCQSQQYGQVEFRIKEQTPSGTNVGSIRDMAKIGDKVSKLELSSLSFKFLNPNNLMHTASLFSINSDNGAVYTTAMIDRESVCQFQKTCSVEFEATVTSSMSKFFEIVSVRILIEDINDNAPKFPSDEITLFIPESVNVNSEFRIAGATDKDTDEENAVRKYEMRTEYNDMFELKSEMKLDWTWDLSIMILKPLDREKKDHYVLYIIARDNGVPPRSGNVTVHINVTDANDNPPIFSDNTYEVAVPEQAEVGAVVGQVRATDADVGMNAALTYRFSQARSSQLEDLFFIDSQSGEIKVKSELQYEAGKSFETIVVASDRGNPPRASQAILILSILDIGNTPPRISVNPVPNPEGNVLSISEASPVETVVAHVRTDDRDTGLNGIVDCSSPSLKFNVRRFEGSGYLVELAQQLDRESEEEVNVTIICEDRGTPKLAARGWFLIKLIDANDNHPVFSMQIYRANLTENNRKGDRVLTVRADDKDLGENAKLRYSFSVDGEEPSFVIDSLTGEITAGQEFDRETVSQVSFVVMAEDGGKKVGKTSVIVDILDQNDNSPYFTSSLEFQVAEKLPAGSKVLDILEAKDRDDGPNAEVVFSMPEEDFNSDKPIPFVVIQSGIIRTANILDKDKQSVYKFPVIVKDKGYPSRSSSATVTVHVIDSNEYSPVFIFPSMLNNSVRFRSDTPPGALITRLIAVDKDVGRNARLKYSIVAGNHEKVFLIADPNSGDIVLTNDTEILYGLQTGVFRLNVTVRDQGIPVLEASSMLIIHIDYVKGFGMGRTRFDDSRTTSTLHDDDVKYIIIAGVIGGVTVIISVIIVTIILIMRRPERRDRSPGITGVQEQGDGRHFEKQIWQSVPIEDVTPTESGGKTFGSMTHKERVGADAVLDSKASNGTFSLNSSHEVFDPYSRKQSSDTFQGQPQLYTFKKCVLRPPTEDHQSDTSGETTTSDSGRGGSEEDIQLPPLPEHGEDTTKIIFTNVGLRLKDPRAGQPDTPDLRGRNTMAFETFAPRTLPGSSGLQDKSPLATRDSQTLQHPGKHRHHRKGNSIPYDPQNCHSQPYQSPAREEQKQPPHNLQQHHSSPGSGCTQYPSPDRGDVSKKVTFQTGLTTQNLKNWDLCQKLSLQPETAPRSQSGYHGNPRSQRLLFVNRPKSQDDDDNTTTSGSYTISPENECDDILTVSFPAS